MKKTVTFTDVDQSLIKRIEYYQKANNLTSFVAAVRKLCETALSFRNIIKEIK